MPPLSVSPTHRIPSQRARPPRPVAPTPLGLVLYVEVDDDQAARAGTTVIEFADVLREFAHELVPTAETSTAVALAPSGEISAQVREVRGALAQGGAPRGLDIDPYRRTVTVDGRVLVLTLREFELIAYLAQHRGRSITRDELIDRVWPAQSSAGHRPVGHRTVDVHVRRLRIKLGRFSRQIATVRGHGYRLD